MDRLDNRFSHEWHVAINRYHDGKHGDDRSGFMYEAKTCADEVPRMALLFQMQRLDKLPKIHRQCSLSTPEPIIDQKLTCCLGTECAKCPMLLALDLANLPPDQTDLAKAWTCAAHIISSGGDTMREGYILTTDDRMYWDNVYQSLAAGDPDDECPQDTTAHD
jgi:hypothetical protein